jgi:ribonuclease HII
MPPKRKIDPPPDGLREAALRAELGPAAIICGVDEAGRGPLAGPVCAAAVVLEPDNTPDGLNDSKLLEAKLRRELAEALRACTEHAVAFATVEEIDEIGLGRAADLAMTRAVEGLPRRARHALVDGNRLPRGLTCEGSFIVGGDGLCLSIAAASILAKTARDAVMEELALDHPGYGWERNRGYGTPEHLAALKRLGVTPYHRRSFQPVHNILVEGNFVTT